MGMSFYSIDMVEEMARQFENGLSQIRILELGCQQMRRSTFAPGSPESRHRSAKNYYLVEKGVVEHVSIDLNGKFGSLKMDLSKSLLDTVPEWKEHFHCVTNFGTLEHVDQKGLEGQYMGFKNMHDCCKPAGVMVHLSPMIGGALKHCSVHYSYDFLRKLAALQGYIVRMDEVYKGSKGDLAKHVIVKPDGKGFMSFSQFVQLDGIQI